MRSDIEKLERLLAATKVKVRESAPYVPGWSAAFRRIADTVEAALNARVAAELGFVKQSVAQAAALEAVEAIDAFNLRRRQSLMPGRATCEEEREALCRLAGRRAQE